MANETERATAARSAKHTPGPWAIVSHYHYDIVASSWDRRFALSTIASVRTNEADAKLIAAAPLLADALEAVIGSDPNTLADAHDAALRALRLAGRLDK